MTNKLNVYLDINEWRKDPAYLAEYNALEEEFALAAQKINDENEVTHEYVTTHKTKQVELVVNS